MPFYPFLLQCHTLHISKVVDEIWSGSNLKFLQGRKYIIKYIAATRKHCSPVFLGIMTQCTAEGRCALSDSQLGPGRYGTASPQDTDTGMADPENMSSHGTGGLSLL